MFCNVRKNGEIELTATGSDEMSLLKRLSDGAHVQSYDDSKDCCSHIIIAPVLLPKPEMNEEFKVKPHGVLSGKEMVEYWRGGRFVAGIYPYQDGIRVVSKYLVRTPPEGGLPSSVVIELAAK